MDHASVRELLGVYALDACEEDETDAVEAHIAGCVECETEAARLLEVAGWIGVSDAAAPSDELRARLLSEAAASEAGEGRRPTERG
jgi:anti-sigma factor RsiW